MGVIQERVGGPVLQEGPCQIEMFAGLHDDRKATGGGIVRDALYASKISTEMVFEVARASTYFCFALGRSVVSYQAQFSDAIGLGLAAAALGKVESGFRKGYRLAKTSLDVTEQIAKASIEAADSVLASRGSERGDAIRLLFSDKNTKEALLCVTRLLGQLGLDLKTRNPVKILVGAKKLAEAHELNKMERIRARQEKLRLAFVPRLCPQLVQTWNRFMYYAIAAYGYQAVQIMGVIPGSVDRSSVMGYKSCIQALTGIDREDIIYSVAGGEMYYPGHYVALDRVNKHVVVVVRGTMNVQDVLVDLVCESVKFTSVFDEEETHSVSGKAHRGFLIAAQRLSKELEMVVLGALQEYPDYTVVVTGHSLGAGVATLLTLIWACSKVFGQERDLHGYAFGAPCSLCHELSQAPFTKKFVTSFVVGDDFVSRLSFSTVSEIQKAIMKFATTKEELSEEDKMAIYREIPRDEHDKKLFSAGRVWLLDSPEFNFHAVEIDPRDLLHTLELSSTFLHLHLPHRYLMAVKALDQVCSPQSPDPTVHEETKEQ